MKTFNDIITLSRNSRGCYIIDTIKGCRICKTRQGGCYGDCYAVNIAKRYGIDFTNPIARHFATNDKQLMLFDIIDETHIIQIIKEIKRIPMPFVRIGEMGDPSYDWVHTLSVCEDIERAGKPIVIITKHWVPLPEGLLQAVHGLYINTSISALDNDSEIEHRLKQYERLKPYCNSILRIVSCDFNTDNEEGRRRADIQKRIFENENVIDTVFRPNKDNRFVKDGIVRVEKTRFLGSTMLASMRDKSTYLGRCEKCPDMCGITLGVNHD